MNGYAKITTMDFNTCSILLVAIASFFLGIAAFILSKEKAKLPLTWLSLSIAAWCFAQFMGAVVIGREAVLFWTRFNVGAAVLIPVCFLWFVLVFTDKQDKRLMTAALLAALLLLGFDLTAWFVRDVAPVFILRYYPVPGPVYPYFGFYLLLFFSLGFVKLIKYLAICGEAKKNQVKYVLLASIIGFTGGMTAFFPILNLDLPVISHYFMPLYLALILYAIVKHNLLDIKVVIFQGLVYSFLTVFFTIFYVLGLVIFSQYFSRVAHADNWIALLAVVFTSVLIFQPLRDLVQKAIDRIFFRGEFFYRQKISDLSAENKNLFQRLQQADKLASLGTIAAGMAHEIKNPLAAIKGLTQVLPENLQDRQFILDYAEIVPRQLDRINKLVDDLLAFGRPAKMTFREIDLAKLLRDTFKLLAEECRQKGITVRLELLPTPIEADAGHLGQAVLNVLLNAIQAMAEGGELFARLTVGGEKATIEIADTGEGIAADKLAHVFDPFFTTKGTGTGMGLAVTYRIIKDHGGEITVDSRLGEGTTFKICLPIKQKRSA
ncbi:MAG: ATP-binding protein [Candidatus Margulisiibacteriota bacterium]